MTKYVANRPFGGFKQGAEVTGLPDDRAQFLLEHGVIGEVSAKDTTKPADDAENPKAKTTAKANDEPVTKPADAKDTQ